MRILNEIYHLNKDTICMNNSGSYTINQNKVKQYIQSNCIQESHEILNFIFSNIKYITFNIFYSALTKYLLQINKVHRKTNEAMKIKVHIIIPKNSKTNQTDTTKSNFWIALLLLKIIEENKIKNFKITNVINSTSEFPKNLDDSNICIYADDCAYSGQQTIRELFTKKITFNNKLYILIPFISNYAYAKYKTKLYALYKGKANNIIFLDKCITYIETFAELCIKHNFNMFEKDVYYLNKKEHINMLTEEPYYLCSLIRNIVILPKCGLLIYFDHKVADQASTIQYFLNYSTTLNNVYVITNVNNMELKFSMFKKYSSLLNKLYFNKPINNISEHFHSQATSIVEDAIDNCLGITYLYTASAGVKGEPKSILSCYKVKCEKKPKYISILDNCDDKLFAKKPRKDQTAYDLNKQNRACPCTFYKQPNFYVLPPSHVST
jgi:hypothetical protein